jgi:hypothetical protein
LEEKTLKKITLRAITILAVLAAAASAFAAAKPEDVFTLKDKTWYARSGGDEKESEHTSGGQPDLGLWWHAVDPETQEEAKGLDVGVLIYSEKTKKYTFISLSEEARAVQNVTFSPDGERCVAGSMLSRFAGLLSVFELAPVKPLGAFWGYSDIWWLDGVRFAFTLIDQKVERPEQAGMWGTSAAIFDPSYDEGYVILKGATATESFTITGTNEDGTELTLSVTSVESAKDWEDVDKWKDSETTAEVPAAG